MKAIRKLLAMALVVVMVLSMSTFVFATESVVPLPPCNHNAPTVCRYQWVSSTQCSYYLDVDGVCTLCGEYVKQTGTTQFLVSHYVEEGDSLCIQCRRYGCIMR